MAIDALKEEKRFFYFYFFLRVSCAIVLSTIDLFIVILVSALL